MEFLMSGLSLFSIWWSSSTGHQLCISEKLRKENEELRLSNKRKRKYREEIYTLALNGDLLPAGLSKIGENAYQCEKENCGDCQNFKSPFSHFKVLTRNSRCRCHMCQLYNSSGKLEIFQELAELDHRKTEYKKKRHSDIKYSANTQMLSSDSIEDDQEVDVEIIEDDHEVSRDVHIIEDGHEVSRDVHIIEDGHEVLRTEEKLQAMYNQNVRKLVRMKTCDLNEQEAILKSMGIVSLINIE